MNLTEWARLRGVHPQAAYRWFRGGTVPVPAVRVNSRSVLVAPDAATAAAGDGGLGLSARVSSHGRKTDLGRRVARLAAWAARAGRPVARIGAEVGSGMNGARSGVRRLLAGPRVRVVAAGHRGRLGRMNAELAEAALAAHGRRLVVPGPAEAEDDLVRDMTEILTSFCACSGAGRRGTGRRRRCGAQARGAGPAAAVSG